ncbi:conserved hypothetical protein [Pseudomonas sp. 8Z]|uniref:DUF5983 family protein n=1 Tax=Pseudomonas sp. 8Z TaxID=2653166 RepID=UPI0012F0B095|nr:ABC transporter substrate-binding protein [Pseudomonas sp. 8Z]VXC23907.1 conserved hypothetical protein [Pseudomonas sp. 8Z]
MPPPNPFANNPLSLTITRLLQITYANDCPPCHRLLHPTQEMLSDDQLQCFPCAFTDETALITEGQDVDDELLDTHISSGIVRQVIYAINGDIKGVQSHVADTYSAEQAQQLVDLLNSTDIRACSAWEISDQHLDHDAHQYLVRVTDETWYTGLAFEAFKLWKPGALGIQLVTDYWSSLLDDLTLQAFYQEQLRNGVPTCLVNLLHLAAAASVRYVMFDPDASQLDGLPVFERVELNESHR